MSHPHAGSISDAFLQTPEGLLLIVRQVKCGKAKFLAEYELHFKSGTKFHEKTHVCHHESSVKCDGQEVRKRFELENSNIIVPDDIPRSKVFIFKSFTSQ